MSVAVSVDAGDVALVRRAGGLMRLFNEAGVLVAADVHVALRVAELAGEADSGVQLAAALAVRAPRHGHVFVDLSTVRETAGVEVDSFEEPVDLSALPWPEGADWLSAVAASALVAVGEEPGVGDRPLRLLGTRLYLDRYWREERAVAADLLRLTGSDPPDVDRGVLADGLRRLFSGSADESQRLAAGAVMLQRIGVVAGGPGTGKTTTVARIAALLAEQAAERGLRPPLLALAAPTGKASARLQEAVHEDAGRLDVSEATRSFLRSLRSSTLHRLLGWRRGSHSRFAHDRFNKLPHEVVIVDETSMVSLPQMARLVEAVRPDARLVLVGDPGQLTSIEAGVVLADIVGPAASGLRMRAAARAALEEVVGSPVPAAPAVDGSAIGDGIIVLERVHRYGSAIAAVAGAIRVGDGEETVTALSAPSSGEEVVWLRSDASSGDSELALVRDLAVAAARSLVETARAGDGAGALAALGRFRLLCAHRRGFHGVSHWTSLIEGWISDALPDLDVERPDYVGRPLLITENDYELGLYNGDSGVIVAGDGGRPTAVFERGKALLGYSPLRLSAVQTLYAMTIHKSQGSQFDTAAVLLPPAESRLLTRELLYTAVTRARKQLVLVGTEESVRAAVARPVARASGLRERLWGAGA